jgi:eukaryotic-like serine/threonine-protein kinase
MSNAPSKSNYDLLVPLARGGMASVFVGRRRAAAGFTRLVAIKRAHRHIARDAAARAAILEEVSIASKLNHPNLVAVHDVEELEGELLLVMDYVEGATVAELVVASNEAGDALPAGVGVRILLDACAGLHAAHTLTDEHGRPYRPVHRDVSPQNILVGLDGVSRVTDFGIAKSVVPGRHKTTRNVLKGKVAYMAPEYIEGRTVDARADVFALGVVGWEMLANRRLFRADGDPATLRRVLHDVAPALSSVRAGLPPELDAVLAQALAKDPEHRFASAEAFGMALEGVARHGGVAVGAPEVARTVQRLAGGRLEARRATVRAALGNDGATGGPASEDVADEESTTRVAPRRAGESRSGSTEPTGPTRPTGPERSGETKTAMIVRAAPGEAPSIAPLVPPGGAAARRVGRGWMLAIGALAVGAVGAAAALFGISRPGAAGLGGTSTAEGAEAHGSEAVHGPSASGSPMPPPAADSTGAARSSASVAPAPASAPAVAPEAPRTAPPSAAASPRPSPSAAASSAPKSAAPTGPASRFGDNPY